MIINLKNVTEVKWIKPERDENGNFITKKYEMKITEVKEDGYDGVVGGEKFTIDLRAKDGSATTLYVTVHPEKLSKFLDMVKAISNGAEPDSVDIYSVVGYYVVAEIGGYEGKDGKDRVSINGFSYSKLNDQLPKLSTSAEAEAEEAF